jgi:type IV pilus assembly protein PilA
MKRKNQKGFSLLELLIVVTIILIIAAIAIPNLNKQRMVANEASAIGSLRTLITQAQTYFATYGNGFPPSLGALGPAPAGAQAGCNNADLIDSALASGRRTGYTFTYAGADPIATPSPSCANPGFNSFTINAEPDVRGKTGQRSFYTDQSGTIRFNATQPATATDPPIS